MNPPKLPNVFITPVAVPPSLPPMAVHIAQALGSIRSITPKQATASTTTATPFCAKESRTINVAVAARQVAAIRR